MKLRTKVLLIEGAITLILCLSMVKSCNRHHDDATAKEAIAFVLSTGVLIFTACFTAKDDHCDRPWWWWY